MNPEARINALNTALTDAESWYRRGFEDCRSQAMNVVDEHDGFLQRIEYLQPTLPVAQSEPVAARPEMRGCDNSSGLPRLDVPQISLNPSLLERMVEASRAAKSMDIRTCLTAAAAVCLDEALAEISIGEWTTVGLTDPPRSSGWDRANRLLASRRVRLSAPKPVEERVTTDYARLLASHKKLVEAGHKALRQEKEWTVEFASALREAEAITKE